MEGPKLYLLVQFVQDPLPHSMQEETEDQRGERIPWGHMDWNISLSLSHQAVKSRGKCFPLLSGKGVGWTGGAELIESKYREPGT